MVRTRGIHRSLGVVLLVGLALVSVSLSVSAQVPALSDREQIERTIQSYFDGWATGDSALIGRAMHASAHLKRSQDGKFVDMTRQEYLNLQQPRTRPPSLATTIVSIDIVGPTASARTEISVNDLTFVDFFNLLRFDEGWRIVDKIATPVPRGSAPGPMPRPIKETVLEGLRRPWGMVFLSPHEVLISEKEGALLRVDLRSKARRVIAGSPTDLADSIGHFGAGDNTGRFDVVLDPDFVNTGWVYLSYAAGDARNRVLKVVRARLRGDSLHDVQPVFVAAPPSPERVHYGGGLVFGRDGKLYVTVGERLFTERSEPAWPLAQDRRDPRGKIYRLNPDGSIPRDNPDFGAGAVPGLYALGIRASQALTVEPRSGAIWFSEHGTHRGDELNVLRAGANYGWPLRTTGAYRDTAFVPPAARDSLTAPVWSWVQTVAPTALHFYVGDEFPSWRHSLLVGGLSAGSLWRLRVEGEQVLSAEELFVESRERIREVLQSPTGELYILTDQLDGKLIRIRNAPSSPARVPTPP